MNLPELARESLWLWEYREGVSLVMIARRDRTTVPKVRDGIERATRRELAGAGPPITVELPADRKPTESTSVGPHLEPLFPIVSFVPASPCPHRVKIRKGSHFVCMVCHQSGLDHLACMRRPRASRPNKKTKPKPGPKLTRKQRRALKATTA